MSAIGGDGGINPYGSGRVGDDEDFPSDAPLASSSEALTAAPAPAPQPAAGAPSRSSVMLNLTAAPGTVPPGDDSAPRIGTTVIAANPLTNTAANSADYAAISSAMGFGMDKLAEKFPDIDKNFAARFLEAAISTGAQVPLMVVSHEAGHAANATAFGADPSIQITGYMSGLTTYTTRTRTTRSPRIRR
jgi:hypothetical protein